MSALARRITRLEAQNAPDLDDPLGLRDLDDGEMRVLDRLITALTEGGDIAAIEAELEPRTVRKLEAILGRAQRLEASGREWA